MAWHFGKPCLANIKLHGRGFESRRTPFLILALFEIKYFIDKSVWPYWAIFESSWVTNCHKKLPKYFTTIWDFLKGLPLWLIFRQLKQIGVLFIPFSGLIVNDNFYSGLSLPIVGCKTVNNIKQRPAVNKNSRLDSGFVILATANFLRGFEIWENAPPPQLLLRDWCWKISRLWFTKTKLTSKNGLNY